MDQRHRTQELESIILRKFKSTTPIILLGILAIYILNVNSHYRLFLSEDEKLRTKIESLNRDYYRVNRFVNKVFNHLSLTGQKSSILSDHISGAGYKLAVIMNSKASDGANNILVRIAREVESKNSGIKIITFADQDAEGTKHIKIPFSGDFTFQSATVFLFGNDNEIISALSIDGIESQQEVKMIVNYIHRFLEPLPNPASEMQ